MLRRGALSDVEKPNRAATGGLVDHVLNRVNARKRKRCQSVWALSDIERPSRAAPGGQLDHVLNRANARLTIFENDEDDTLIASVPAAKRRTNGCSRHRLTSSAFSFHNVSCSICAWLPRS